MRLRFAVSGHAQKVEMQKTDARTTEVREQAADSNPATPEAKATGEAKSAPAGQTPDMTRTTNDDMQNTTNQDTKTKAATGS
jgi:hypothetical protein